MQVRNEQIMVSIKLVYFIWWMVHFMYKITEEHPTELMEGIKTFQY